MIDTKGCLYALTFPNGKQYIGITSGTLRRRVNLHRSHANTGRPGAVYNAIRKYGTRAKIGATHIGNAYNLGSVRSEDSRAKMRLAQKGRTFSDETKLKMSIAAKNRKPRIVSASTRLKMSIAAKNRKLKNG